MFTVQRVILPLRVFLVALFGILLVLQTLSFPGQFAHMAETQPEQAYLRWPLTALAVFCLLCAEATVVATWKLLTLVKKDRIFTEGSMIWVDLIVWALSAVWLVLVGFFVTVVINADDPGMPMVLLLLTTALTVFILVVMILRALLGQATQLRSDLDEVI
ncbi:hypothetical protein JOF53_002208 [Crossiella equi]|uniref:DUF2975 domain-containing protein n=1 Tax=Crossiella equi TaxID=130796 RepID=A0ABS5A9U1_9PSEU|nr:DUF2975 domain-containing protein [Crossiella equi]MBP2473336.1 hypothetical protein [Crossiella equi]